ncbi:hypothetical protein [Flavobacterium sp. 83]|uniref:hypothetical protein n=1 Tax=Flavobacterium sp. 83 TaxID=1131812 RepID=UPI000691B7E9|nr:hypothetical protein [Flavobacterium sp. 83]
MKSIIAIVTVFIFIGCQSDKPKNFKFYKALKGKDIALLRLMETENNFYGQFEIKYGGAGKDSGEVRGVKIGDTLKGKYDYRSYGGNKKWAPFVLLRRGEIFKWGNGVVTTYMNIPFIIPETLKFDDSDFQFELIDSTTAKKLDLATE